MDRPLVSVICVCYNHERFVREAIESVLNQRYSPIEIIVVDDASTDNSVSVIKQIIGSHPEIKFIALPANTGNCKAFNTGLAHASGSYIVDFSTDDVFFPQRISKQVELFARLDSSYGVVFTDALYISEDGTELSKHFSYLSQHGLITRVPQGEVYASVLSRYFISSPTMLVKREVFDFLNGYDEKLAYEDFDFWVRSARKFKYAFLDEVLTKVRKTKRSLNLKQYTRGDQQLYSTYLVCEKARVLNETVEEDAALIYRVRYELRHAVFTQNHGEARMFYSLLTKLAKPGIIDRLLNTVNKLQLPLSPLRKLYHRLRY